MIGMLDEPRSPSNLIMIRQGEAGLGISMDVAPAALSIHCRMSCKLQNECSGSLSPAAIIQGLLGILRRNPSGTRIE